MKFTAVITHGILDVLFQFFLTGFNLLVLPTGTPVFNLEIPGLVVILWALWAFYPGMKLPEVFVFWFLRGFLGFHGSSISSPRGTLHLTHEMPIRFKLFDEDPDEVPQ